MRYIVLGMRPLSTVEDENFVKIIKGKLFIFWIGKENVLINSTKYLDIDSDLNVYSRRTLSRRVNDDYTKVIEEITNLFKTEPRILITSTADIWSTKHRSFMGVTAHWVCVQFLIYMSFGGFWNVGHSSNWCCLVTNVCYTLTFCVYILKCDINLMNNVFFRLIQVHYNVIIVYFRANDLMENIHMTE